MTLFSLLVDEEKFVPIETLLTSLNPQLRSKIFRMLQQDELKAQGRTLLMDTDPLRSGLGNVFDIPVESWLDAETPLRDEEFSAVNHFRLKGPHPEDVIVEINLYNTEQLRELAKFEAPSIGVEEYDEKFFKYTQTKMGAKVWARAAAALASEKAEPTGRQLAAYLLAQDNIWPNGSLSEDQLRKHLSPLISEFKRLVSLD